MENEFKENVTYIEKKLRESNFIKGEATHLHQETHGVGYRLQDVALDPDFFYSLEERFFEAHECTGKDYRWYIMYLHTLGSLEITIQIF